MRRYKYLLIPLVLGLCSVLIAPSSSGQGNYVLTNGNFVGGGGASNSGNNQLVGTIGFGPMGFSTSSNYILNGGLIGAMDVSEIFFAIYDVTNAVDTVAMTVRNLSLHYGNATGEVSGYFFYRFKGAAVFDSTAMTVGGNTLTFNLTTLHLTPRGLDYYFKVYDDIGITRVINHYGDNYSFIWYMTNSQGRRPTVMPEAKYRTVGLPVNITGLHGVEDVFVDDLGAPDVTQWRLGRYEASEGEVLEYPPSVLRDVNPGVGYWLAARHNRRYGAEGYTVMPTHSSPGGDYFVIALDSGWNQVANPFAFPVNWNAVIFEDDGSIVVGHPSNVLDNAAWWYDGDQFLSVDSIPAWDGFFVNIKKNNIRIFFPFMEYMEMGALAKKAPETNAGNWQLGLELSCQEFRDVFNFVGVRTDALPGGDKYDFAEPPSPPGAPYLALAILPAAV